MLLLFEMHHLAFYALFGALGSFAAALVAVVAPSAIPLQVLVSPWPSAWPVSWPPALRQPGLRPPPHGQLVRGACTAAWSAQEVMTLDAVGDGTPAVTCAWPASAGWR